ncbi:MAG: hypothetical protein EOO75_14045, partial [Myxococcales bacterium]
GDYHACVILDAGTVKCWGGNSRGQLGLGDTQNRGDQAVEMGDALPFVELGAGLTAQAIVAGSGHTCALLNDQTVKCWGWNVAGQLGLGDAEDRGDKPGEMGDALPAVDLGAGAKVTRLAASGSHTCAVLSDGSLRCWGFNASGQLGLGDTSNRGDEPGEMGNDLKPAVSVAAETPVDVTP